MKEKIKLSGVPETMLQTIYARAKESGGRGTIHDTKAEEIVGKLDYDFTLAEKDTAMHSGVIARTTAPGCAESHAFVSRSSTMVRAMTPLCMAVSFSARVKS